MPKARALGLETSPKYCFELPVLEVAAATMRMKRRMLAAHM
jgi:hypothetical protein